MKKQTQSIVSVIVGILVCVLGILGVYWVIKKVVSALWLAFSAIPSIDTNIAVALVTGGVAIVVAILANVISNVYAIRIKNQEHRQQILKEHRENTIPQYKQFIDFTYTLAQNIRDKKKQLTEDEIKKTLDAFIPELIIWGSDEVVKAFYDYRQASLSQKSESILIYLERFILAMRKDLGHKNKNLKQGTVLGLFVNDIQKFLHQRHDS